MDYLVIFAVIIILYGTPVWIAVQNGRSLVGWLLLTIVFSPIVSLIVQAFLYGNGALKAQKAV